LEAWDLESGAVLWQTRFDGEPGDREDVIRSVVGPQGIRILSGDEFALIATCTEMLPVRVSDGTAERLFPFDDLELWQRLPYTKEAAQMAASPQYGRKDYLQAAFFA